jgi:hypothetical protein
MVVEFTTTGWYPLSLTDSSSTTDRFLMDGFHGGSIINLESSPITVTAYNCETDSGTAYAHTDCDGVAVTQTIAAGGSQDLHPALWSCTYVALVLSSGSASVKIKRTA